MKCIQILVLLVVMTSTARADNPAAPPPPAPPLSPEFVGNYMGMFNPSAGGATQMWTVDIDEQHNYLAFCTNADFDAVRGRISFDSDRWSLRVDNKLVDEGAVERMGPSITLRGGRGMMMLSKVSPESRQKHLNQLGIDPKKAEIGALLERGLQTAREWRKDAVLVDVRCQPDVDGTLDLTVQGGNVMMFFYCPSRDSGALAMVSAFGEISLMPQKQPVSPWKLAIPTNCIGIKEGISAIAAKGFKHVKEAELYGLGDDPDLRTFCWVIQHDNGVVCVDALQSDVMSYDEFTNGVGRGDERFPFAKGRVSISRITTVQSDATFMYFCFRHDVFLDGVDKAIAVRVPWRFIPIDEWIPFTDFDKDGNMMIGDLSGKLKTGKFTPLSPEHRAIMEKDHAALAIDCSPGLVMVEDCPKELLPRVKEQLESYWKRSRPQHESPQPQKRRTRM